MDHPSAAGRPRRSRLGLVLFLALLALAAWEVLGRATPYVPVTPLRFAGAAWDVACGHQGAPLGAPSEAAMKDIAYRPLPYVMFGLKPDWKRRAPDNRPDQLRTSNSEGFRGPEIVDPKPAGRYRIVCLGGSTTYGDTVSDADAYPRLLEKLLRERRPGRDIEVINAGVVSYTTAESLANLAFRCLDFQPDAIVLYEGINDYRPREYGNFTPDYFHYRKVWDGGAAHYETEGEGELKGGFNPYIQQLHPDPNGDKAENARRAGTGAFRRNLVSIAGIAKAHGIAVAMVSCACDERNPDTDAGLAAGIAEHNGVVREVAAQQGALFIDLAGKYEQAGQFDDAVHMNPAGELQMARIIADGLLAGLL